MRLLEPCRNPLDFAREPQKMTGGTFRFRGTQLGNPCSTRCPRASSAFPACRHRNPLPRRSKFRNADGRTMRAAFAEDSPVNLESRGHSPRPAATRIRSSMRNTTAFHIGMVPHHTKDATVEMRLLSPDLRSPPDDNRGRCLNGTKQARVAFTENTNAEICSHKSQADRFMVQLNDGDVRITVGESSHGQL